MLRTLLALFQACALLCGAGLAGAQELQAVPALTTRVTDLTATLSADEVGRLDAKLAAFERSKGVQIAVLLVPTVKPEAIEQYSIRAVEAWKLGRKGVDDGALLLIAKQDRKLRIEVGYGLEGALTDAMSKRIVSETISPRFKQGDFHGGIDAGVDAMIRTIGGEPLPAPRQADSQSDDGSLNSLLPILFVLVFVVGNVLRAIFGRFLGAGIIGAIAGGIAWLLISSLLIGGVVGVLAFVVSLFAGLSGGGWSSGGGSWGGGSGGGSWGGGGGGFGGGGASGDW